MEGAAIRRRDRAPAHRARARARVLVRVGRPRRVARHDAPAIPRAAPPVVPSRREFGRTARLAGDPSSALAPTTMAREADRLDVRLGPRRVLRRRTAPDPRHTRGQTPSVSAVGQSQHPTRGSDSCIRARPRGSAHRPATARAGLPRRGSRNGHGRLPGLRLHERRGSSKDLGMRVDARGPVLLGDLELGRLRLLPQRRVSRPRLGRMARAHWRLGVRSRVSADWRGADE